ncbi:unnamed protein product [Diabrotica balteata]|uniref:Uncharacterized protein n=1 Tax=Diabrotica balteata TaxID=107213 RepID=A0A9N9X6K2_DIABA|nr:unnamed protein product [Diabrotica balteata]
MDNYLHVSRKNTRRNVIDTKVGRGPEIGSDHYLVVMKIKQNKSDNNNINKIQENKEEYEPIRSHTLRIKENTENNQITENQQLRNTKENI